MQSTAAEITTNTNATLGTAFSASSISARIVGSKRISDTFAQSLQGLRAFTTHNWHGVRLGRSLTSPRATSCQHLRNISRIASAAGYLHGICRGSLSSGCEVLNWSNARQFPPILMSLHHCSMRTSKRSVLASTWACSQRVPTTTSSSHNAKDIGFLWEAIRGTMPWTTLEVTSTRFQWQGSTTFISVRASQNKRTAL